MTKYKKLPSREYLLETYSYDPEDGSFCWAVDSPGGQKFKGDQAGGVTSGRGFRIRINGALYPLSRIIWYMQTGDDPGDLHVDHIDGNIYNNRFSNLRLATYSQNQANSTCSRDGRSLPRGVYKRGAKYRAQIKYDGKSHCLGSYDTPEQAFDAWSQKAKELWGEFATERSQGTFYKELAEPNFLNMVQDSVACPTLRQVSLMADHCGVTDLMAAKRLVHLALNTFGATPPPPVSVTERLPGLEDCDAEGRCWWLIAGCEAWALGRRSSTVTHWLPANVLPLPSGEVEHD